ncbi:Aminoglycoside/hydroxyurea antibiotic resistance kinase family protein [Rickettsiales endosymbiont of Paramecium tredecaurelia]|uniref:aminoglycoside phosphotransferase family protein n=1 Tax=Candidatus Sarmatiella mevalonica TaxID=2770581 RepID=UPI001925129C|nr:aminoglycoside phosphotransferase family protein [Candidatus Sarmatiella mevalonica]MBL3285281.1 Aminoglycoside/hydroxyurea antibiotic resistance kinase family protein [Candidatus Sarmatiella mevalonica]
MTTFHSNIISIYGEKGKAWLDELPKLVSATSSKLDLRDLQEVTNLTYNYVLSGFQSDNPIILKLGLDNEALAREAFALKCFTGCGAVTVLSEDDGMLLLERAVPGTSLQDYFPTKKKESIEIAFGVIKKLHQANITTTHNFPHIKDWLAALDEEWNIPNDYLQKARQLRDELLQTSKPDVLLHGDLHHDNILQNGEDWLVIDPKGVIGEPAYEVAAFIRNPIPELLNHADAPNIIHNRVTRFAELLGIPAKRIHDWCFVQAVLAWVWALEDDCEASYFQQLTKIFDVMLP